MILILIYAYMSRIYCIDTSKPGNQYIDGLKTYGLSPQNFEKPVQNWNILGNLILG